MRVLLLVYNADSSFAARVTDFLVKIVTPKRYPCRLCLLTFGWLTMKSRWQRYLEDRPEEVIELHRDEFRERFGQAELPAVFLQTDAGLNPLLTAQEINRIATLEELEDQLTARLVQS